MRRDRWEGMLIGLVVGGAMGLLAGLLIAPTTGRDARRRLSRTAFRVKDEASDAVERIMELGDAVVDWGWELFGAEADRTRSRLADLRADVERLSSVPR